MEFIFPGVIVIYIRPTLDFHKTVNVKKWRYWNVRKPEFFFQAPCNFSGAGIAIE